MRPLALAALALSACSGLPPDTLLPLDGGQTVGGVQVAVDLGALRRPDVAGWFGVGLGRGVDVAVGLDGPLALLVGGPRVVGALFAATPPGLALRKTWPNGVGVGVGTSTRVDVSPADSVGLGFLSTAGPFVTVGPRPGSWDGAAWGGGRVTASVGYARVQPGLEAPASYALAAHVGAQLGGVVADDDTVGVFVVGRAQAGAILLPRPTRLHGPALGLAVQAVERPRVGEQPSAPGGSSASVP